MRILRDVLQVACNFARRKLSSNALAQLWNLESHTTCGNARLARNSDGKSLLFQRNSLCPKERCKKSWVAALTNYCQSHSSHSAASFLSNCEMGTYIRRMGVLADRHFPSETSSYWNIGGFAVLAVIFTLVFFTTEACDMKFSLPHNAVCDPPANYFYRIILYDYLLKLFTWFTF